MTEIKQKLWNGRKIKEEKVFNEPGTFKSMWAAERWLSENGYSFGSTTHGNNPVAIRKGEYDLPQKWNNFTKSGKASVDGVMVSSDWREGSVKVILFEPKTIL